MSNTVRTNRVSMTVELRLDTFFTDHERDKMIEHLESVVKDLSFVGYVDTKVDV